MKKISIFFACVAVILLSTACHTQQDIHKEKTYLPNPAYKAEGKAVYTTQWCGGARPTVEIEKFHYTPRPVKHTTLIFTHREHGAKITSKTDAEGNFVLTAGEGEWDISISEDFYEPNNEAAGMVIPKECDKFYGISYGRIHIRSDTTGLLLQYSLQCDPCDPYGNMQP